MCGKKAYGLAFEWLYLDTIIIYKQIISKVNTRSWKFTHKFCIGMPRCFEENMYFINKMEILYGIIPLIDNSTIPNQTILQ